MSVLKLIIFIVPFITFSQELITEVIDSSDKQGVKIDCGFSTCNYFETFGNNVSYQSIGSTSRQEESLRYLFNHPNFTNDKIEKIILEVNLRKLSLSTDGEAIMQIKVPKKECNNEIPWFATSNDEIENLYSCNKFGDSVFEDGIGTSEVFNVTKYLSIYDKESSGFPAKTLQYFDASSDSFTLSFTPIVGSLAIKSVKVHLTYKDESTPNVPILSGSSNSTSSIDLSWNTIFNATSYDIFNCSNQKLTTVTSNSYRVTGLSSGITYGYKIRASNSNGNSAYSSCKNIITQKTIEIPATPILSVISNTNSSINLSWNTISNATSYEIYNCDNALIAIRTSNSFTHSELNSGTEYSYKIRSRNSDGASSFSSCFSLKTLGCVDTITLVDKITTDDYNASNTIIFSNSTVEANNIVKIYAGSVIRLLPFTHLKSNSIVSLKIQECDDSMTNNKNINNKEEVKNNISEGNIDSEILYEYKFEIPKKEYSIIVSPNPFNEFLNIKMNEPISSWKILSMDGKNVTWGTEILNQINTAELSSGIYLMKITLKTGEVISTKILKN